MWSRWGNKQQMEVFRFYKQQHRKPYVKKTVGLFTSELNTKLDKASMRWQCSIKTENNSLEMSLPQKLSHEADTHKNCLLDFSNLFSSQHSL